MHQKDIEVQCRTESELCAQTELKPTDTHLAPLVEDDNEDDVERYRVEGL